jgi:hypothetical protein
MIQEVLFPALFSIISYVAALRDEEVPLMDLAGTRAHYEESAPLVVLTFFFQFFTLTNLSTSSPIASKEKSPSASSQSALYPKIPSKGSPLEPHK